MQSAYEAHLAANAAAQQQGAAAASDGPIACADGFIFWQRDAFTPLCEPLCASDADCGPDDGRCRILDVGDRSPAPPMLIVDDMSQQDVDAAMSARRTPAPVMVCDPFFDVSGATDVDFPGVW